MWDKVDGAVSYVGYAYATEDGFTEDERLKIDTTTNSYDLNTFVHRSDTDVSVFYPAVEISAKLKAIANSDSLTSADSEYSQPSPSVFIKGRFTGLNSLHWNGTTAAWLNETFEPGEEPTKVVLQLMTDAKVPVGDPVEVAVTALAYDFAGKFTDPGDYTFSAYTKGDARHDNSLTVVCNTNYTYAP